MIDERSLQIQLSEEKLTERMNEKIQRKTKSKGQILEKPNPKAEKNQIQKS
jgi:hypothetical protein